MKKIGKILTLVLVLAILTSVFALAISANTTPTPQTETLNETGSDFSIKGSGTTKSEKTDTSNSENKYTQLLYGDAVDFYNSNYPQFSNAYIYLNQDFDTNKAVYYVHEMDISTDSTIPQKMSFVGYIRAAALSGMSYDGTNLTATTSNAYSYGSDSGTRPHFEDGENGVSYFNAGGSNAATPFSKDAWTRVSIVYEVVRKDDKVQQTVSGTALDFYDFGDSKIHYYVNGVLAYSENMFSDAKRYQNNDSLAKAWIGTLELWGWSASTKTTDGESICFDNIRYATYVSTEALTVTDLLTESPNPSRVAPKAPVVHDYRETDDAASNFAWSNLGFMSKDDIKQGNNWYRLYTYTGTNSESSYPIFNQKVDLGWTKADNTLSTESKKYAAFEFDMSTNTKITYSMYYNALYALPSFNQMVWDATNNVVTVSGEISENGIFASNAGNRIYFNKPSGGVQTMSSPTSVTFAASKWTRFSVVFELVRSATPVVKSISDGNGGTKDVEFYDYGESTVYFYLDGTLSYSTKFLTNESLRYQTEETAKQAWVGNPYFKAWSSGYLSTVGDTMCFDNTSVATYYRSDITASEVLTPSPDPVRTDVTYAAVIDGVKYTAEGLLTKIEETDGLSIKLYDDMTTLLDTKGKSLTLDTAGYEFAGFVPGYYNVTNEENVYTVTAVSREECRPVELKVNLSLFTDYNLNFYIPADIATEKSAVIVSDYDDTTVTLEKNENVTLDELQGEHTSYTITLGTADTAVYTFYMMYKVNGVQCGFPIIYGVPAYAKAVMDSDVSDNGKTLVMSLVNYADKVLDAAGETTYTVYDNMLANPAYAAFLNTDENYGEAVNTVASGNVSIYFSTNVTSFAYKPADGAEISSVMFQIGNSGTFEAQEQSDGTYLCKIPTRAENEQRIADMSKTLTITVNGENVYTYNLAAYIASVENNAEFLAAAKALYAYSKAAEAYVSGK